MRSAWNYDAIEFPRIFHFAISASNILSQRILLGVLILTSRQYLPHWINNGLIIGEIDIGGIHNIVELPYGLGTIVFKGNVLEKELLMNSPEVLWRGLGRRLL